MKTDWTDKIRETLSQSAVTPPDDIWAAISSDLDAAGAVPPVRRSAKKVWRWCAAAACLCAAIACGVLLITHNPSDIDITATPAANLDDKDKATTDIIENLIAQNTQALPTSTSASNPSISTANTTSTPRSSTKHSKHPSTVTSEPNNFSDIATENHVREMAADEVCEVREGSNTIKDEDYDTALPDSAATLPIDIEDLPPLHNDSPLYASASTGKRHISFSFYASNLDFLSEDTEDLYYAEASDFGTGSRPPTANNYFNHGGYSSLCYNEYYVLTDADHRQPLRFGASVRIPLSKSLSIGTGANYSRLSSSLTFRSEGHKKIDTDQTLHYIGIPVSIDYALPSYRSVGFYFTAGAMAEKCVYGRLTAPDTDRHGRVSEKSLQMSMFAGGGLQVGLYKGLSLYVEPVASYYFDNHSTICNIYKERPFNVDLRLGLRLTTK